jgi:hypothetical protein
MTITKFIKIAILTAVIWSVSPTAQAYSSNPFPFSTNSEALTVWNGASYSPITIKGINLGVAIPGTFPSELNVTYDQYIQWFNMIREAGFNTIRLYTLHYPQFYKALRDYNLSSPKSPLLVLHGVWLEEELEGYHEDLFYLQEVFTKEIRDNVNCIHGNNVIPHRYGKAYGTYDVDISEWVLGYIIGREVHPSEVTTTNSLNIQLNKFSGKYLSINNTFASEVFVVSMMDELLDYEMANYQTQRPISFSSWPTLDPMQHPTEVNTDEDKAQIDLSQLETSKAKAGVFISYHAYPYYPDFISEEDTYTGFYDYMGQNSYYGYLTYLKNHYPKFPLIIAEFGIPSSWGIAHYAHSGMNHGGVDEKVQGLWNMRLMGNIVDAGCGGGIMFSWIDEWFKRTWITDPMDFLLDRRILWQNITAAEQNFGLLGFKKNDGGYVAWNTNCTDCPLTNLMTEADFAFFKLKMETAAPFGPNDTLWVAIDTYDAALGESILPNKQTTQNRAEFALLVTLNKAELFVTQAYDLFGIWHNISAPEQLFHSIATDGAPWNLVKWKNNDKDQEVQYIGSLKVNKLNLPPTSLDAITITDKSIEIKLPWTLLNIVDPSTHLVMHDDRSTPQRETMETDGIAVELYYKNKKTTPNSRYKWESWNNALNTTEYEKQSYAIVKNEMYKYPGALVAHHDSYQNNNGRNMSVSADNGLLANDRNYDGGSNTIIIVENPKQGLLALKNDGSFTYMPDESFSGIDKFKYLLANGLNRSNTADVEISLTGTLVGNDIVNLYPNPSTGVFSFTSQTSISTVQIYNAQGVLLMELAINAKTGSFDLSKYNTGNYFAKFNSGNDQIVRKLTLIP